MPLPFVNNPVGGEAGRAAFNFFGVDPSAATDFFGPNAVGNIGVVPQTRTRTSHALLIRVAGARVIGAVNGFTHTQTRQVDEVFDVDQGATGYAPVELIPQNTTTRTLRIQRYDLFATPVEAAFGPGFEYTNLADQARPFVLRTIWRSPVASILGGRSVYEYTGCYFTSFGRTVRSDDTRIVNADAEIVYALRRKVV